MFIPVHDEFAGSSGDLAHQNCLEDHMGNQLFGAVGTAGLACDYTYRNAGDRGFCIELLQVRRAAVVPYGNRMLAGPAGDAAGTFRRKGMGHILIAHIAFLHIFTLLEGLLHITGEDLVKGLFREGSCLGDLIAGILFIKLGSVRL